MQRGMEMVWKQSTIYSQAEERLKLCMATSVLERLGATNNRIYSSTSNQGCRMIESYKVVQELRLSRFSIKPSDPSRRGAAGYRQVKVLEFFDCLGLRQGVEDLRELLHKVIQQRLNGNKVDKRMASMHTRFKHQKKKNLDGNIVQKHGGSKQVGFKQLGPGVETGVHGVHDEKRVWFEVELQGAQGDREAEVFQVSNDDTAVAQRRLEDKQPEEKTNTDCLVKEQKKGYQTGWKIKTGNILDSCNQRSTQQCMKSGVAKHLGVAGIQQQNGLVDETNVTLFAK
ncbi:hypothetical protein Tco_1087924, partial [Tanacetum coccineum]